MRIRLTFSGSGGLRSAVVVVPTRPPNSGMSAVVPYSPRVSIASIDTARQSPGSASATANGPLCGLRKGCFSFSVGLSVSEVILPLNASSVSTISVSPGSRVMIGLAYGPYTKWCAPCSASVLRCLRPTFPAATPRFAMIEEETQSETLMHEPSIQNGMAPIPVGRRLKGGARAHQKRFGEVRPNKLQADGQTRRSEASGHGDGWIATRIEWTGEAQQAADHIVALTEHRHVG